MCEHHDVPGVIAVEGPEAPQGLPRGIEEAPGHCSEVTSFAPERAVEEGQSGAGRIGEANPGEPEFNLVILLDELQPGLIVVLGVVRRDSSPEGDPVARDVDLLDQALPNPGILEDHFEVSPCEVREPVNVPDHIFVRGELLAVIPEQRDLPRHEEQIAEVQSVLSSHFFSSSSSRL